MCVNNLSNQGRTRQWRRWSIQRHRALVPSCTAWRESQMFVSDLTSPRLTDRELVCRRIVRLPFHVYSRFREFRYLGTPGSHTVLEQ